MFKFLKNLYKFFFAQSACELEVRFHKQANVFGEHGTICVTHVKQGLVETPVRFVFVGLTTPPKLDLFTYVYIWEEAKAQGYIPHHVVTYGKENECVNTLPKLDTETVDALPAFRESPAPVHGISQLWKEDKRKTN